MDCRECLSKILGIFISLVFLNILISCSDDGGNWELFHTVGEITKDKPAYSWYQISSSEEEEKYLKFVSGGLGEKVHVLPPDSTVSQRLNYWISLIDSTLRKKYPDQFKNVPTPRVLISDSTIENAFINTIPVCYNVPVVMKDEALDSLNAKDTTSLLFVPKKDGGALPVPIEDLCQKAKDESDDTIRQILQDVSVANSNCPLELKHTDKGRSYIKVPECKGFDANYFREGGYNNFVITSTPNILMVLSGLLEVSMDETFIISILAHEVSHYYRMHLDILSSLEDEYDFVYKITEQNPDKKPEPTSDSFIEELGKKATNTKLLYYDIARIKDQTYRSEMFDALMALDLAIVVNQKCENEKDCNNSCKQFFEWFRVMENHTQWSFKFPMNVKMSTENINQYLQFEKLTKSCLENVSIGDNPEQIAKGFEITQEKFKRTINNLNRYVDDKYFEKQTFSGRVPDIISNAQTVIEQYLANQNKLLNDAYENRVGIYTKEQEADELSVELLHEIGLDLKRIVESYLTLSVKDSLRLEVFSQDPIPHSVGFLSCLDLYNKGWKNPDGSHHFVGVSIYQDSHHSTCFRAYNIDKEISAHKEYKEPVSVEKKEFLTTQEYENMIKQIREFRAKHRGSSPTLRIGDIIIIP